jgi:branched-chain amino acid transport system substrate-binding protein
MKTLLTVAAALAGLAGTAAAQTPGVTDNEIVIGMFSPLSGPLAIYGIDPVNAAKMWYEEVNKKGGIHGRKIRTIVEDDKCNANEANAVARKLVTVDKVFLLNGGSCTAATVAIQEYVTREKVPHVMLNASGDGAVIPPTRYVFGAFPGTQRTIGAAIAGFGMKHLKAKRVAYITSDDDYGRANYETAKEVVERAGGQVVAYERVALNVTDVTSPVLNLRSSNPDIILSGLYPAPTALLVKKVHEFGMKQPIVQGVQGVPAPDALVKNVGDTAALANFYYSIPLNDVSNGPKQQQWLDMYRSYYPDRKNPSIFMAYGLSPAMAVTRALEASGRNLTRESFVEAMEKLSFDSGVTAAPIAFGKDRRDGMRGQVIVKFDGNSTTLQPGVYIWEGPK